MNIPLKRFAVHFSRIIRMSQEKAPEFLPRTKQSDEEYWANVALNAMLELDKHFVRNRQHEHVN